jgi:hypothetical protein
MPHSLSARLALALALAALFVLAVVVVSIPVSASAHTSGCHSKHTCPSDHATYRWRGLLCVKPSADERTSRFRKRVRYGGRTYYCKR